MEGLPAYSLGILLLVSLSRKAITKLPSLRAQTSQNSNPKSFMTCSVVWIMFHLLCLLPMVWPSSMLLEDNDAVIKMCVKERSPALRHVSRTHRVDLDWLFERIQRDPGVFIKFVPTKEQLADILTKGSFTAEAWNTLSKLCLILPRSAIRIKQKQQAHVAINSRALVAHSVCLACVARSFVSMAASNINIGSAHAMDTDCDP